MNKLSKGIVLISAAALTLGLAACGSSTNSDAGHVYFLNNKPEVVDQWNELADMYTKETGVQVDIQSATSGSYESTLSSELAKNNAPTMFGIGGFDQYAKYKNYLEPLQDSEAYKLLNEQGKQMAHKDGDDVYGLPYAAEWFGIIANKKIINEYAKKSYSVIKSFDDIKDFATLKKVADSIQQHKDDLGLDGAFSTPGLDASNYYRYASHMTQVPVAYEYIDEGVDFEKELKGTYLDNYKALWDLEMKDNPTENTMLGSVNYEDSTAEFSTGRVAFYPNGVWAYSQIKDNDVADEDHAAVLHGLPERKQVCGELHLRHLLVREQERIREGQEGDARLHQVDGHQRRRQEDPRQGHGLRRAVHHVRQRRLPAGQPAHQVRTQAGIRRSDADPRRLHSRSGMGRRRGQRTARVRAGHWRLERRQEGVSRRLDQRLERLRVQLRHAAAGAQVMRA